MKISKILLYDEPTVPEIKIQELSNFLEKTFSVKVETRQSILSFFKNDSGYKIASCKVINLKKPFKKHNPTQNEISIEENNFLRNSKTNNIVTYDGFELLQCYTDLIPIQDRKTDVFHIIFTNKLTCTFDFNDYRYHGRAIIGANPTIISTTGIIEAPAKPREYYLDLMMNYNKGINTQQIKNKYNGVFLKYNDSRLSKIIEGYLMQAVFYFISGDPFCKNKKCRLFNSHWQKDLLFSQIKSGKLCSEHQEILNNFKA